MCPCTSNVVPPQMSCFRAAGPLSGQNVHDGVTDLLVILHGIKSDAGKPLNSRIWLLRAHPGRDPRFCTYRLLISGRLCAKTFRSRFHASGADKYFELMSSIVKKAGDCSTVVVAPEWHQR